MTNNITNKRGFTILELIIALAIATSLLAIAFPFYINHQNALNRTNKKSQLQMDMQLIMESLTKSAMEASKISSITSVDTTIDTSNLDSFRGIIELQNIEFTVENSDDAGNRSTIYLYRYSISDGKLYFTGPGANNKLIGQNIKYIKVVPLDGKTYAQCAGIKVEIRLSAAGIDDYDTWSNVYFRNK